MRKSLKQTRMRTYPGTGLKLKFKVYLYIAYAKLW